MFSKAGIQQQRLPPDNSSKFTPDPRSRLILPRIYSRPPLPPNTPSKFTPDPRSRLILPLNLLWDRALALDFLEIRSDAPPRHSGITLSLWTSSRFTWESHSRSGLSDGSCRTHALATRPLDLPVWVARPTRPLGLAGAPRRLSPAFDVPRCPYSLPSRSLSSWPSLSLSSCSCLHPLPVLGAAPTTRGRKGRYTPKRGYDRRRRGRVSRVWDIHVG